MPDLLDFGGAPLMEFASGRLRRGIRAAATAVRYQDGAVLHAHGDDKPGLSIVRSGAVRFGLVDADGTYIATSLLGAGHCFGEATLFAGRARTHDAVAVGETIIEQIDKARFDRLLDQEPDLARALLKATTRRLYSALDFMDDLRRLPLPVRTAKLVALMANSAEQDGSVACNQADLAFTLGVSRVSVGKALGDLQKEGILKLGYGKIDIPSRARLHEWIADRSA
ncbi:MAG: Crp/Fnr family transcriptional regulator [Pseudomonadota bacterium]